jgi:hypothetical protein
LAAIALQYKTGVVDIDLIATTAQQQMMKALLVDTNGEVEEIDFASEQACLVEGMIRGFYKHVWSSLVTQYPNIIAIEQEVQYKLDDSLLFMAKPDLVLADNEGNWHYCEYKSTSSKSENWVNSWATAIQLQSTVKAIEQTLGTMPIDVQVLGLYKGFSSYNKQNSPYCYCYKRTGTPPFSQDQTEYSYKAGFKRFPVWEMPGGVKAWIEGMPANILGDQFPTVPPIFIKEELVDAFFRQLTWREKEIDMAMHCIAVADEESKQEILNVAFPQVFQSCDPYFGKPCQYKKICFGHSENPLQEGFIYREPHHDLEKDLQSKTTLSTEIS